MATITASMFMALDGVVDPGVGNWHFPYFNDEMGGAVDRTHDADVMLFGRVTYDSFAGAWPGREAAGEQDAEFAEKLGDMRKIVVSHRPLEFTWRNSEQLQDSLAEGVAALKAGPSIRRIALSGSVSVVRQLLAVGLLDELHLFVHPALAGTELRLFQDGVPEQPLRLLSSQPFANRSDLSRLRAGPEPAGRQLRASQGEPPAGVTSSTRQPRPAVAAPARSGWCCPRGRTARPPPAAPPHAAAARRACTRPVAHIACPVMRQQPAAVTTRSLRVHPG